MDSQDQQKIDDRLLVRYLLGALSREETERLDELSIVDDDFASRVAAAEDDLVDAYVRKELSPSDSEKFASSYLASAKGRQKVDFAQTLLAFKPTARASSPETETAPAQETKAVPAPTQPKKLRIWLPRLAFATAALALLLVSGYMFRENTALRTRLTSAQAHQQQLEQEVARQSATNSEVLNQLEQARTSQSKLDQLQTVVLLLPPPTRGAARIPVLSVHPGVDLGVLLLALESDHFAAYRAVLKDPGNSGVVWQSGPLESSPVGERKAVAVALPTGMLRQQNYTIELTGIPAKGTPERIGDYPIRLGLK